MSKFTAPRRRMSFGDVAVGHTATRFIHIVNAGNEAAPRSTTTKLTAPFRSPYPVDRRPAGQRRL